MWFTTTWWCFHKSHCTLQKVFHIFRTCVIKGYSFKWSTEAMHSWKMMKSLEICLYVTVVSQTWRIFEKKLKKLKNLEILEKLEKILQEIWRIVVKKDGSHEEPCLDNLIKFHFISMLQQRCKAIWKSS